MKNENGRTYDFCRAGKRTDRPRARGVSELIVDGWSAYYQWLAELKRRLSARAPSRQAD